jgi:hypothetical protein
MYPLKGNEAVIGLDQLKDPVRRPAALTTIASGNLTMQGPLMLKQGFLGVIPRLPIFITNVTDPQDTFGWDTRWVLRGSRGAGCSHVRVPGGGGGAARVWRGLSCTVGHTCSTA